MKKIIASLKLHSLVNSSKVKFVFYITPMKFARFFLQRSAAVKLAATRNSQTRNKILSQANLSNIYQTYQTTQFIKHGIPQGSIFVFFSF